MKLHEIAGNEKIKQEWFILPFEFMGILTQGILELDLAANVARQPYSTRPLKCQNYASLNSGDRKITFTNYRYHCDSGIGPGWFRFEGSAGTRMPTSCPPYHRCGTYVTGWLNGGHPTVADGQVSRQVCFHYTSSCCDWSKNIKVRNCGSYYVYFLSGTPGCNLRYCSTN
ncbi:PREDICTED: pancreatic secretory granule membrane major glycoprotein GP2-like isoform X2 [Acropora digitifera]|uniref:pancreatic secretory granule membrane major glycoprotein GP2-like isoform X2 n=1 Tax=Acropora digitifera TaxID=70779 RepID=UPI00077AE06C|nr:PREDICTED: pancreatic secretory granule membrane major glycoprotein GP2-like isoform X2 [Acropora digitifera]